MPIFRDSDIIKGKILNTELAEKILDFEKNKKNNNIGFLLHGEPGCGKTTMINFLSKKLNRNVYLLNIGVPDIWDGDIISLMAEIPPNSILVIEELEKQLIKTNNFVTYNGLLTGLDGPQRLSKNTIVIVTANSIDNIDEKLLKPLCRPERLDYTFEM